MTNEQTGGRRDGHTETWQSDPYNDALEMKGHNWILQTFHDQYED